MRITAEMEVRHRIQVMKFRNSRRKMADRERRRQPVEIAILRQLLQEALLIPREVEARRRVLPRPVAILLPRNLKKLLTGITTQYGTIQLQIQEILLLNSPTSPVPVQLSPAVPYPLPPVQPVPRRLAPLLPVVHLVPRLNPAQVWRLNSQDVSTSLKI